MTNNDALNIIDNSPERKLINILKDQIRRSEEAKFAIGYFFLTGFSLVESDFPDKYDNLPFLKVVMGNETTYPTKEELVAGYGYKLRELFKQRMIEDLQKRELSHEQIKNKVISSIRVWVEHAIGGIKRMRITTDKFRNKKDTFNDKAMLISCGLWNYHLMCR